MNKLIFLAGNDWTGLILRLTLGLILLPHGLQKAFGWYNGFGFSASMDFFTKNIGLPWLLGFLVILLETLGALCVIAGFGARLWSIALLIIFIGMIITVSGANGFFMNWFNNQKGEGYEYHLLMAGLSLAILLNGSGRWSIDRLLVHAG